MITVFNKAKFILVMLDIFSYLFEAYMIVSNMV